MSPVGEVAEGKGLNGGLDGTLEWPGLAPLWLIWLNYGHAKVDGEDEFGEQR